MDDWTALKTASKKVFDEMSEELEKPVKKVKEYDSATQKLIEGVAPDAPIHRHESGGLESKPAALFTKSFPWKALFKVAEIVLHGVNRYAPNNWRLIPREAHLNHCLIHIAAYMLGDTQDAHLEHAACRLLMALEQDDDRPYDTPEAGCAKCATDWTDAKHDGDCKKCKKS